jgi:ATP-dependent Clp protease ATP-binding subunit ClpC
VLHPGGVLFSFPCVVVRHTSGRVTLTPLEHPELAVHADSQDDAVLDLTLALDDRIRRAHPRHLWRYAGGAEGEPGALALTALPVWHGDSSSKTPVKLFAWKRQGLNKMQEVYLPRLDLRFWIAADAEPQEALAPVLLETLEALGESERIGLVVGGRSSFEQVQVDCDPMRLSALRPGELGLDARPFRSKEEQAELDAEEENVRQRRQKARADERKRREKQRRQTPTLKQLALALHTRAARGRLEPAWERDAEVERLLGYVERERPAPLVLVAPQGSGKTALLEALARRMGDPKGPRARRIRPIFLLDGSRMIAGMGGFGEWQRQLQECVEEARRSGAVLYLGRLVDLLDAGKSAQSDNNVAQALAPVLASREFLALAEATLEDWALIQRRNASFASVWSPWLVEELGPEAVRRVLERVAAALEERSLLRILPEVVGEALALCRRFWPYGSLVGNAVTFLRRLVAARVHERAQEVRRLDVIEFFSGEAGIPPALLRDDLPLDPGEVEAFLAARVMAQPRAVERAVQVVSTLKASLQDPRKPAAVLLFAGPTGVGKTELAKALAEFVFGSRDRMIRVDMGEYLGPDALARLLGDGDGSGLLPAQVRRQPFCVLLLDELEKAHPVVFDALLGVLGEGRLSDADGRFTDFRNAVIVMTTNLGADTLRSRVGFGGGDEGSDAETVRLHYLAEAQRFFRPEFFNRIDDLIVFRPLGAEAIQAIVRREVHKLSRREGLLRRDIDLHVTDDALDLLAAEGLDPRLGARPLKRTIERRLAVPAASWLASHRQANPTRVRVDVDPRGSPAPSASSASLLQFRAESLRRDAEGSRGQAEVLLDDAADLRSLVARWDRCSAVQQLRSRLAVLDHSLRGKGFWDDKALAEELTREASLVRGLVEPLAELRRGAEAAEDLAIEAWYDRRSDTVETLHAELNLMRERFAPLPRRIFLGRGAQVSSAILYLTAPRGAWSELLGLFRLYQRWALARELQVQGHRADPLLEPEPGAKTGAKQDDPDKLFKWVNGDPMVTGGPLPAAIALKVQGTTEVRLLQAEEGTHRFGAGADSVVRVRFYPVTELGVGHPRELKWLLPQVSVVPEIRRYSRSKESMHDQRLDEVFKLDLEDGELRFDLDAFQGRWMERSCMNDGEATWS